MGKLLHASESGWFTNCINDPAAIESYEQNPDALDLLNFRENLETWMYVHWVVREIKIEFEFVDGDNNSYLEIFRVTCNQQNEESLVCEKTFTVDNSKAGFSYSQPIFEGVLGIPKNIYAGVNWYSLIDNTLAYQFELGAPPQIFNPVTYTNFNYGNYSVTSPVYISGAYTLTSITATATSWFSYGGTWSITNGILIQD